MPICRTATATGLGFAVVGLMTAVAGLSPMAPARAQSASVPWAVSPWVKGHASTTRLVAGTSGSGPQRAVVAGVEIKLNDGWKTYWRSPGDAGGVPPAFDWTGSSNIGQSRVLYPAPDRLPDPNGDSIGYKKSVVFPVEITPADPAKPVVIKLTFEYGICREICVPAEAKLDLTIAPSIAVMPPELTAAMARVPRTSAERQPADPALKAATAVLSGTAPTITFDIATGSTILDLFVEGPDGVYLPMPKKKGAANQGVQRFEIDLKGVDDVPKLSGKTLRLTATTATGGAEASWVVK